MGVLATLDSQLTTFLVEVGTIFRALRNRNYRLYFTGQIVSLIGIWMQTVSIGWLTYRLTQSALMVGITGFFTQIPMLILTPVAGVFIDRWDKKKVILIMQWVLMTQALMLAILTLMGTVQYWHVIVLSLYYGMATAFEGPARQAFVIEMIEDKEDLGNAIALNSMMFNSARLVGPAVAGILISVFNEGVCFLINGLSFSAVIISLNLMTGEALRKKGVRENFFAGLKSGFKYVYEFDTIRVIIFMVALINLLCLPYTLLMPVVAREVLHGGAREQGFLVSASGIGALIGGLYLASRKTVVGLVNVLSAAAFIFGFGLIALSFSRVLWLSVLTMFIAGLGMILSMASCNTLVQTLVDDDKRGRVMSIYMMAAIGVLPFGHLLMGALAKMFGAPVALLTGGTGCIIGAVVFALNLPRYVRKLYRVYIDKGMIESSINV
ncbi:MAG: MFS transporter [Elusimicrobiota bacterium]